jgi:TRAP transporter 4TM/12TM fusion protein
LTSDPKDGARRDRGIWIALGGLSVGFHLYLIFSGLVPNLVSRPLHMALAAPWALIFVARTRLERASGYGLSAVAIAACLYIVLNQSALGDQYGYLEGPLQMGVAAVLIVAVLEMGRRFIGWPLPMVASIALLYGLFGQYVPGELGHGGLPVGSFLGTLTIAEGGLWGELTAVSVNIVAVFVIFGAVLNAGEAGQGFMNLAVALAGRLRAGAAKVSVLASAFFGSISGSASANVASTGSFTLPAMRRLGYPPAFAGAVEAVASSGGQIMPPLMGAGAFVMVELLQVPYTEIMVAALLPAILFFVAVWAGVDSFAERYGLEPMSEEDRVPWRRVAVTGLFFAVPFTILLERLFHGGYTAQYAASVAIAVAAVLLAFDTRGFIGLNRLGGRLADVCVTSGKQIAMIASIILCAGLIVGVLGQTGLGVKITSTIVSWSGGHLWIALLLTAVACLILGMEVPTTAAYVICVSVTGPALHQLGVPLLHVHLFVFWYALLSTITPPVCGTVFIAAGMVNAPWLRVAGHAMALGLGLYIIPLMLIHNQELIEIAQTPAAALVAFAKSGAGLYLLSRAVIAKRRAIVRVAQAAGGLLLLMAPGLPFWI